MSVIDIFLIWLAGVLLNLLLLKVVARQDKKFEVTGFMLFVVPLLSFLFLVISLIMKIIEYIPDTNLRDL